MNIGEQDSNGNVLSWEDLFRKNVDGMAEALNPLSSRPEWTRFVKRHWGALGQRSGFEVWGWGDNSEYLVDLCWRREPEKGDTYTELALESEWDTKEDAIIYDFYKLVDVKAHRKVMICQISPDRWTEIVSVLAEVVKNCPLRLKDEEYLVVVHRDDQRRDDALVEVVQGFVIDNAGKSRELGPPERVEIVG